MSFDSDVGKFVDDTDDAMRRTFVEATVQVRRSIVEGSDLTSAPGQPVDTGALKASFIDEFTGAESWRISTNLAYAPVIEEGVGFIQRSPVGGSHSLKMTVSGWERIVQFASDRRRRHHRSAP